MSETQPAPTNTETFRRVPLNSLDSAWMSAVPDYSDIRKNFQGVSFVQAYTLFNSSLRLGKLTKTNIMRQVEYDLVSSAEALALGYIDLALSIFFDVCAIVEISHADDGFRTEAMNKVVQEIRQYSNNNKKSVVGREIGEK